MPDIRVIPATVPDKRKLRVAAYCRVSSDSADQQASYLHQVDHYTKLIASNPEWEMAGVYADEGLTGTRSDSRDEFQRMLRDCKKGRIDRILVKSISRFARNTRDCLDAARRLKAQGVSVYFERENIDTDQLSSEMLLCLYSASAQQESESISQNMRWSYRRRMERGEFITCSAPFGYRLRGRDLVIEESEAEVVRWIFREYLSGTCRRDIAAQMRERQVSKKAGSTDWRSADITLLLQNEKYAGNALLQKTYSSGTLPFRTIQNRGEVQQYHLQGSHPAIVTIEEYDRARELAGRRKTENAAPTDYPFTKRITCAHCGTTLKRRMQNGKVSWICYRHYEDKNLCPTMPIPEPDIQMAFVRLWNKLQKNRGYILTPLLNGLRELKLQTVADPAGLDALNRQIAELNSQMTILTQIRAKGYLDEALYIQQAGELESKLRELRFQRKVLLQLDEDDPTLDGVERLSDLMDQAEPLAEFNEAAFSAITHNLIADNTKLQFRLIGGLELSELMGERSGWHEDTQHPLRLPDGERRDHSA